MSDLLEGAKEISDFLSNQFGPNWTERRIRYLVEAKAGWPIFKLPGVGLAANKASLLRFIESHEARSPAARSR